MRKSLVLPIAAAVAFFAIESSAYAASRGNGVVVRDHRAAPVVRDHRTPPVVRDHRAHPAPKKVIRAGRNYDKVPNRVQVVVNGKRVPRYR
jgi:2,3-bisphosphoglycerate-independent phosphoglycerate mutase